MERMKLYFGPDWDKDLSEDVKLAVAESLYLSDNFNFEEPNEEYRLMIEEIKEK